MTLLEKFNVGLLLNTCLCYTQSVYDSSHSLYVWVQQVLHKCEAYPQCDNGMSGENSQSEASDSG